MQEALTNVPKHARARHISSIVKRVDVESSPQGSTSVYVRISLANTDRELAVGNDKGQGETNDDTAREAAHPFGG